MKEKNFLDELFEKARYEKDFIPPKDILDKGLSSPGSGGWNAIKLKLGKALLGVVAITALVVGLIKTPSDKEESSLNVNSQIQANPGHDSAQLAQGKISNPHDMDMASVNNAKTSIGHARDAATMNGDKIDSVNQLRPVPALKKTIPTTLAPLAGDINKMLAIQQMPVQQYTLDMSKDTVLKADGGTLFHIESHTFCDQWGKVVNGAVELQVKECYTPSSFLRENLSTSDDSGVLLETGGMYYLNAMRGNDTLKIRKGYEIGISPNYKVPERMELYYGQRDSQQSISWTLDPVGKIESPLFISIGGQYGGVMNPYFSKNYKLEKQEMLALMDSQWSVHFTSDDRKVVGYTDCSFEEGMLRNACEEFVTISHELARDEKIKPVSRMTSFDFQCMSRNQYAYYLLKRSIDSFGNYVPGINYRDLGIPAFFAINMGWINLDCSPVRMYSYARWKLMPKNDVVIKIPENIKVNATLFLPESKSIARMVNDKSGVVTFKDIPKNQYGNLLITAFVNDVFYLYRKRIDTDDFESTQVEFEKLYTTEAFLAWLENAEKEDNLPQ